MNLIEALEQAKQGKKVRREAMRDATTPNARACIIYSSDFVFDDNYERITAFHIRDVLATDWEVVE